MKVAKERDFSRYRSFMNSRKSQEYSCDYSLFALLGVQNFHQFLFFIGHVFVVPAPNISFGRVRTVARSLDSTGDQFFGREFQIISPSNLGEEVDECGAEIERVITQFGGLVIPRKRVVVVVEAFAEGDCRHGVVF